MRLILTGEAEVAVVGGAEGSVDPISVGGFGAARALSTAFNDDPEAASRPFDRSRDGFVLAEGAAVLVIERLSHAVARGATPLAILAGYGTSADAYHLTSGEPTGAGAQVAMRNALKMAGRVAGRDRLHQRPLHLDRASAMRPSWPASRRCSPIAARTWRSRRPSRPPVT